MTLRRLVVLVSTLLLGAAGSFVAVAPAHAALTHRTCASRTAGNYRLDFCIRGWVDATNDHTRAVVEMHSYRWVGGGVPGGWVDSTSKSMTVRVALMANDRNLQYTWGAVGSEACRVNGPGGPVACSVPNTARVAFYSPNETPSGTTWYAGIYEVSFRDAAGVAHYYNRSDRLQMITETWYA